VAFGQLHKTSAARIDSERRCRNAGRQDEALVADYNIYAKAAQAYMNCVGKEAEADQFSIGQAISSGAKDEITAVASESEKLAVPLRTPKK